MPPPILKRRSVLFEKFVHRHGSVRRSHEAEVVFVRATLEYVSANCAFRSREVSCCNLVVSGGDLRLRLQMRRMRSSEDGPGGRRQLS